MMSEEWPIAAPADSEVASVRPTARDRLATVRRDFFLDSAARLSEQERALMTAMLDDLVSTLADEIIAALPNGLDAIGEEGHEVLIARLSRSGLLDRPALVALLLRRADEQRFSAALRPHGAPARTLLIQRWIADADGDLAAAAMALVLARGRRRDRFGQGRLLFDDLPAEEAVLLVQHIAAALRTPLPDHPAIDRALAEGAQTLLSRHDEGERVFSRLSNLVRLLDGAGRVDDVTIEEAAQQGEIGLLSALLAHRAHVPEPTVWDHLVAGGEGRFALLARLAGLGRSTAARLIAELAPLSGIIDPAAELTQFDRIGDEAVENARGEWRLPLSYITARAQLRG